MFILKKIPLMLLALSLALNILLGIAIFQNYTLPTAEAFKDIKDPGTYGPPATEIIDDDITISTADVTLQNTLITGNLYLTDNIPEGTITLNQVEIQGEVIISAGSKITLLLIDSSLIKITVQESGGAVTIIAQGSTSVDVVDILAEASLQEDGLIDNAQGFKNVRINTDKKIVLLGDYNSVDIAFAAADVKVVKGSVASINIIDTAQDTELDLAKGVQIESLSLNAVMTLLGDGNVHTVSINVPGLVKLQGTLEEVTLHVGGIFLELGAGSIEMLLVPELESASSINLAADTMVENMELNGRTSVKGQGQIGSVTINASGVEIDRTPAVIVILEGLVAMINREEYKYEPVPEPEPEPTTPTVVLNSIGNVIMRNFGDKQTVNISATAGAKVSVSSNSNVASVSLSGNTITITGNRQGTATITVRATMSGYNSRTRTFRVTVNPIKSVKRDSMNEFTHTVAVVLHNNDPSKYKVELQGWGELPYDKMGSDEMFWAIVPSKVQNNSIIVTRR